MVTLTVSAEEELILDIQVGSPTYETLQMSPCRLCAEPVASPADCAAHVESALCCLGNKAGGACRSLQHISHLSSFQRRLSL